MNTLRKINFALQKKNSTQKMLIKCLANIDSIMQYGELQIPNITMHSIQCVI
jgi:hypothetical protein